MLRIKRFIGLFLVLTLSIFSIINVYAFFDSDIKPGEFEDVKQGDWFYESVCFCHTKGLIKGINNKEFAPFETMDRGMFVSILYRMAGSPEVTSENHFSDVSKKDYFYSAVKWAVENELVFGIDDTHFAPKQSINREQMACMIARYAKAIDADFINGNQLELVYKDQNEISPYALESVDLVRKTGLMLGDENNRFSPKEFTTRAQAAMLFMRFKDKLEGSKAAVLEIVNIESENNKFTLTTEETNLLRTILYDITWKECPYAEYVPTHIITLDNVEYRFEIIDVNDYYNGFNFVKVYGGEYGGKESVSQENMNKIIEIILKYKTD